MICIKAAAAGAWHRATVRDALRFTGRLWHHPRFGALVRTTPPPARAPWGDVAWRDLGDVALVLEDGQILRVEEGQPLPDGFILGDARRQRFGMNGPRVVYGPVGGACRACGQPYTFAATEQRHWYEVLGIHTEAYATRCAPCRADRMRRIEAHQALERAVGAWQSSPTPSSQLEVARAALHLATAGGRVSLDRAVGHARAAAAAGEPGAEELLTAIMARRAMG